MFKRVSREMFGDEVSSADEHFGSAANYRQQAARKAGKQKHKQQHNDKTDANSDSEASSNDDSKESTSKSKRAKCDNVLDYFVASVLSLCCCLCFCLPALRAAC
jgi:hypothetical protein